MAEAAPVAQTDVGGMMCLAVVYLAQDDGQQEQILEDVAWVELAGSDVALTTLLGESKLLRAQIESIDLMKSVIVLRSVTGGHSEGVPEDQRDGAE